MPEYKLTNLNVYKNERKTKDEPKMLPTLKQTNKTLICKKQKIGRIVLSRIYFATNP